MHKFFPYDNTLYSGEDFGRYTAPRSSGVYSDDEHFSVEMSGDTITIGTGQAWMKFDKMRGGNFAITAPVTKTIPTITTGQVARLFFRADVFLNTSTVEFRVGVNAGAANIQPQRNNTICELAPYDVVIAGGVYKLNDNRMNPELCGVMKSEVDGIPTGEILSRANGQLDAIDERFNSLSAGKSPYVNETTGTWFQFDDELGKWVDTGVSPEGQDGLVQSIAAGTPNVTIGGTAAVPSISVAGGDSYTKAEIDAMLASLKGFEPLVGVGRDAQRRVRLIPTEEQMSAEEFDVSFRSPTIDPSGFYINTVSSGTLLHIYGQDFVEVNPGDIFGDSTDENNWVRGRLNVEDNWLMIYGLWGAMI